MRPLSRDACDLCFEFKMLNLKQTSKVSKLTSQDDDDDDVENEDRMLLSALHITEAKAQRVFVNQRVRDCKLDNARNLHFYRSRYACTFHFPQNLGAPHFGKEQPGDTYCYSPLSLRIFGIVDHSPTKDHLYGFLHHEGEGKKGGNNAGSLVHWFLKKSLHPQRLFTLCPTTAKLMHLGVR